MLRFSVFGTRQGQPSQQIRGGPVPRKNPRPSLRSVRRGIKHVAPSVMMLHSAMLKHAGEGWRGISIAVVVAVV